MPENYTINIGVNFVINYVSLFKCLITVLPHKFAEHTLMDSEIYKGKISFINYEKEFATIEYLHNNKQKSVKIGRAHV